MLSFLLVNIFLGIAGTFWFRTQHRRGEMGLRMALGSSRRSLWNMLTGEGVLLLVIAALPATILCFSIGRTEIINKWQLDWNFGRFMIGTGISFILMAIMIILGIWYPAQQAMRIEPAEALHEE